MSRRKDKLNGIEEPSQEEILKKITDPWISLRSGIIAIAIVSLVMFGLVILQGNPSISLIERIGWGLGFGASIWVIAISFYVFNKYILRR